MDDACEKAGAGRCSDPSAVADRNRPPGKLRQFRLTTAQRNASRRPAMTEVAKKARDVFGVGREKPLNYVERTEVDGKFIESLTRDKHVVIYGSSKQGKTALRKHCLDDGDYVVVSCLNSMRLGDLHGAILKATGYRIEQTQTKTVGGNWKYGAEFKGEGKVPYLASLSGQGMLERQKSGANEIKTARLELDLFDVNDIITALTEVSFHKFIILEDFHYLPTETQKDFSFALKVFHENSRLCFIVIGVWRDKNRLIYYNGDLTSRVVSIDVDLWSDEQLRLVVQTGEQLLNVHFDDDMITDLVQHCSNSVSILQEACCQDM